MVVPSRARSSMTSAPRQSARDRGRRSARRTGAPAAPCTAPARWRRAASARRRAGGYSSRLSQADLLEERSAVATASLGTLRTRTGASMQVPQHRHVREQVELWNTIPARSRIWRISSWCSRARARSGSASTCSPSISTRADGRLLQEVDAAQERALAAAGSADEHHRLAPAHLEVHAAQNVAAAEDLCSPRQRR